MFIEHMRRKVFSSSGARYAPLSKHFAPPQLSGFVWSWFHKLNGNRGSNFPPALADAAARFKTPSAERSKLREALPPLASNDL